MFPSIVQDIFEPVAFVMTQVQTRHLPNSQRRDLPGRRAEVTLEKGSSRHLYQHNLSRQSYLLLDLLLPTADRPVAIPLLIYLN